MHTKRLNIKTLACKRQNITVKLLQNFVESFFAVVLQKKFFSVFHLLYFNRTTFLLVLDCGHPGTYLYARSARFNGTQYGAVATLQCQEGYWFDQVFESIATIRCGAGGTWQPSEEQIMCLGEN